MKSLYLSIFLAFLSCGKVLGQDISKLVTQAYAFVDEKKYKEALKVLRDVDERYVEISEDSCAMMFYYTKGSSLYFLDRFEDAIPYLNKALLLMEKFPHEDCIYLELIYGIGSCYNKLKQYHTRNKTTPDAGATRAEKFCIAHKIQKAPEDEKGLSSLPCISSF